MMRTKLAIVVGLLGLAGFMGIAQGEEVAAPAPAMDAETNRAYTAAVELSQAQRDQLVAGMIQLDEQIAVVNADSEDYKSATLDNCRGSWESVGYKMGGKIIDVILSKLPASVVDQSGLIAGCVYKAINAWGIDTSWWPGSKMRPVFYGAAGAMNDKYKAKYSKTLSWPQ